MFPEGGKAKRQKPERRVPASTQAGGALTQAGEEQEAGPSRSRPGSRAGFIATAKQR